MNQSVGVGAADVRRRIVEKAKLVMWEKSYWGTLRSYRARWNDMHPSLAFVPCAFPQDLAKWTSWGGELMPPQLVTFRHSDPDSWQSTEDLLTADNDWSLLVRDVRRCFWPSDGFAFYKRHPFDHPATAIAAAFLLFDLRTIDPEVLIETHLQAQPRHLGYVPPSAGEFDQVLHDAAKAPVLWSALKELLRDDPARLAQVAQAANHAGDVATAEVFPDGPGLNWDTSSWYWHLEIIPGMSARDIQGAAQRMVEISDRHLNSQNLGSHIQELRELGLSQAKIARHLGSSEDTVRRAIRANARSQDPAN